MGATNVSITGGGLLDGQGWHFWALKDASVHAPGTLKCSRPHLVEFEHSADVSLTGLTLQNSPFWTTHFIYSRRIRVSELTILAPATRGNTDGINPDSSTDVIIENVYISNGDDGIAIKSGLNAAGIAVGLPSANIFIRNVTTDGRGGIAIGSEMSGGVKNVTIQDVRLLGQRGIHMKTTRGRGGYIENITMINATARAGIQLWSTYGATVKKKKRTGAGLRWGTSRWSTRAARARSAAGGCLQPTATPTRSSSRTHAGTTARPCRRRRRPRSSSSRRALQLAPWLKSG